MLMKPSACFIFLFGSFSPGSNLRNVVWLWMPKPTYRGLNECHRDPEIVSDTHLVLAQPKAVKLLAYTTDDLKMKKKKYKHCNSQPDNKGNVLEVNVIVLCVYSWNHISGFSADTSQWSKCWVSLVPIRLYGTGRRCVFLWRLISKELHWGRLERFYSVWLDLNDLPLGCSPEHHQNWLFIVFLELNVVRYLLIFGWGKGPLFDFDVATLLLNKTMMRIKKKNLGALLDGKK